LLFVLVVLSIDWKLVTKVDVLCSDSQTKFLYCFFPRGKRSFTEEGSVFLLEKLFEVNQQYLQRVLWGSNLSLDFSHDALKDFFWVFVRVYGLVKQVKHASDNCALKASLGAEILAFAKKCAE
jgi:hypothetical protein